MSYHQHYCLGINTDSAQQGQVLPSRPCLVDGKDAVVRVYIEG